LTLSDKQQIKTTIKKILLNHDVSRAGLFGSFIKGTTTKKNDIDLLIEYIEPKSLLDHVGLKLELENALNRNVDLVTYNSLHAFMKESILKELELLIW
jgi:predicted nucleotidyltransferase